jgi:hypothetical protein
MVGNDFEASFETPDIRTKFFEMYKKEADEYDRVFYKKYEDDLNTTLIFVSNSLLPAYKCVS